MTFQDKYIQYLKFQELLKAATAAYHTNENDTDDDDDCIITAVTPAKRPAKPQPSHNVTVSEQRHTAVSQHTKSSTVTSTVSSNAVSKNSTCTDSSQTTSREHFTTR